jgi:succinyl-diaminopimelate desuccinylase
VKGDAAPGAPFGEGCLAALGEALAMGEELGLATKNVDGYAGHIEIGAGDEIVGVLNHLDVVPEGSGWDEDIPPYEAVHKDGCIFGRGTSDNKGAAAVSMYCLKAIRDMGVPLKRRVRLILGTDEESGWEDMRHYLSREALPDLGFSPDAGYPICNREKGILNLRFDAQPFGGGANGADDENGANGAAAAPAAPLSPIISIDGGIARNSTPDACHAVVDLSLAGFSRAAFLERIGALGGEVVSRDGDTVRIFRAGRPAHGAAPQSGDNAVAHMLEILEPLYWDGDDARSRFLRFARQKIAYETDGASLGMKAEDEPSGPLTVNMGIFALGADSASLHLDIRYPVTHTREAVEAAAREIAGAYGLAVSAEAFKAPLYVSPDSALIAALSRAYERVTGAKAELYSMGGGTYARVLRNNGVAFGPGGLPGGSSLPEEKRRKGGAHAANEYCVVEDLMRHAEVCIEAIIELANC